MPSQFRRTKSRAKIPPGFHPAWAVAALTPHPLNPRRGDVRAIAESILVNGFYGCVLVQATSGYVIAGNHALKAAIDQGAESVPIYALDVGDQTAKALMVADNRLADLGDYDRTALATLLREVREEMDSFAGTGFAAEDANRIIREVLGGEKDEDSEDSEDDSDDGGDDDPKVWRLAIRCRSEAEQKKLLKRLVKLGHDPKASIA